MTEPSSPTHAPESTPPPVPKFVPFEPVKPRVVRPKSWVSRETLGWPISRFDTILLILITCFADFCTYPKLGGTGCACLVVGATLALLLTHRKSLTRAALFTSLLLVLIALAMAWNHWWLQTIAAWGALFILGVKLRSRQAAMPEATWLGILSVVKSPARFYGHVAALRKYKRRRIDRKGKHGHRSAHWVVLAPIIVCVFFVIIFCAANPVLSRALGDLLEGADKYVLDFLEQINGERAFIWILWAILFAGLMRCARTSALTKWISGYSDELSQREVLSPGPSVYAAALSTLISVNLLFLAYNAFDAVYLYFKATLPEGITWTQYTHTGCGWLTFGLFLSTLVIGAMFWSDLNFHPLSNRIKKWALLWVAQNAVLGIGTLRRIQLYIDYSGLTHLRLTGIIGAILVGVGLAFMTYKVHNNRSSMWLFRRDFAAFLVAICVLCITPHDILCASYNTGRILEHKPRALRPVFLKTLDPGALPHLIPLLDYSREDGDTEKEDAVRKGIAALLGENLKIQQTKQSTNWRSWQASRVWALRRLSQEQAHIEAVCPREEWDAAKKKILDDYDLTWIGRRYTRN